MIIWDDRGMAKRYRPVVRDQAFLLPPDMRDWLPADHPVWLVITAVADHLDTSGLHAGRRTGGAGAAGYDPDMLVTLLVWAYASGVTSSRRIEALCRTDAAFAVICALDPPDHVTIARFRAAFAGRAQELFAQVLVLCARLGMGQVGTVALDGTKIAASASKAANRTEQALRDLAAQRAAAHQAADAAEDALFGEGGRGDTVPPDAAAPGSRGERIARALAELEAERQAAERAGAQADAAKAGAFRARRAAGQRTGPAPAGAEVELARERLARAEAAQQAKIELRAARDAAARAAGHRGYKGSRPRPQAGPVAKARAKLERAQARAAARERRAAAARGPGPVRNITDPDSRLMPTRSGFIQGYNPQNVTSADKLIIATELTQDTTDTEWFEPMLRQAQAAAALIAAHRPPAGGGPGPASPPATGIGLFLADAGYLSEHNLTTGGPDRLIATGKNRGLRHTARNPRRSGGTANGPAARAMAARLATPDGITAYRQRGHIAETPHGHIKHNMRFRQLSMRGKPKATAEWTFVCAVHNLVKAITTGHLTRHALTTL
jgi:transposase